MMGMIRVDPGDDAKSEKSGEGKIISPPANERTARPGESTVTPSQASAKN
jgi:hypothetical protein